MNHKERHALAQKIKHLAQTCVTYPSLGKTYLYGPVIKDLYAKEGIAPCLDCFELIHRLNAKHSIVFLDSPLAQTIISWFDMTSSNGKALFTLFEKYKIKTKPLCKVWFKTCLDQGNLDGLKWIMSAYQGDFDFQNPKNSLYFLSKARPNPASLYFCQMLKHTDAIKEKYLKEPENFEEMFAYYSLAIEFRDIFQIKEEKEQIEAMLSSLPVSSLAPSSISSTPVNNSLSEPLSNSNISTPAQANLAPVKNRSKI